MNSEQQKNQSSTIATPITFRDSVSTMDEAGKRKWVYAKKPQGKFTNYRTYVSWVLLIILFAVPFIKIDGNPLLQFNVLAREFYFFGNLFKVQDFYIIAIGAITSLVFIILFTVIYGRIFCGWICPQTIFMEHVFRKIEFAIEGDRNKQIKLDKQEWNSEKIRKKGLKWLIFFIISFAISHTFLSYIIGVEPLFKMMEEGPIKEWSTFIGLLVFTLLFYFVFAWFREQACTLVCPYGRLQGVLIDKKTVVVAYDYKRGEGTNGRATWRKGEDRKALGKGDCIDCKQCVVVCPTGIDIRNGTQLECVNCTACIDACDEVMEKVGLPKNLIKYASEENIAQGTKFEFNIRAKAYTAVLLVLMSVFLAVLLFRPKVRTEFIQVPGQTYFEKNGNVYNTYLFNFMNKTNDDISLKVKIIDPEFSTVELSDAVNNFHLAPREQRKGQILVKMPKSKVKGVKSSITIGTYDKNGNVLDTEKINFIGPSSPTIY